MKHFPLFYISMRDMKVLSIYLNSFKLIKYIYLGILLPLSILVVNISNFCNKFAPHLRLYNSIKLTDNNFPTNITTYPVTLKFNIPQMKKYPFNIHFLEKETKMAYFVLCRNCHWTIYFIHRKMIPYFIMNL